MTSADQVLEREGNPAGEGQPCSQECLTRTMAAFKTAVLAKRSVELAPNAEKIAALERGDLDAAENAIQAVAALTSAADTIVTASLEALE